MTYTSRLGAIASAIPGTMDAATQAAAEMIADAARDRAPVRSGKLKESIHVERLPGGGRAIVAGGKGVFYGHIVEHGGVHTPPRPFLVPAFEATKTQALERARRELGLIV